MGQFASALPPPWLPGAIRSVDLLLKVDIAVDPAMLMMVTVVRTRSRGAAPPGEGVGVAVWPCCSCCWQPVLGLGFQSRALPGSSSSCENPGGQSSAARMP